MITIASAVVVGTACAGAAGARDDDGAWTADHALDAAAPSSADVASRVHARINVVRAEHGLPALAWQPGLVAAAQGHSADMAARDYFSHHSPEGEGFAERYQRAGFHCRVAIGANRYATGGENIAQTHRFAGYRVDRATGARTPFGARDADALAERVVAGWMQSPGHRDNLLRPFWRSEAIGVAIDAQGRVFVTQNFC